MKALAAKILAAIVHKESQKWTGNAINIQNKVFNNLIVSGRKTAFGKDHSFHNLNSYQDYKAAVPIRDYEGFRKYIDRIITGEQNVLWPGIPEYFAKTSGTTSGTKYIPITKDSIPNHITTARNALLSYIHEKNDASFVNGKLIFLSGSPILDQKGDIKSGRLSGIVNHHVPQYLRKNQMPSYQTNCIEDWEEKLNHIVLETIQQDMRLISGIPPWVQMYFDKLQEKSGKTIGDLFPNFNLMVQGGVNFEPYKNKLFEAIGRKVDVIETYPASEGFIAYQDSLREEGLLLNLNSGIFFEFIPAQEIMNEHPRRLSIGEVSLGVNYAIILTTNAGLWSYNIGDTIKFVSLNPYRIVVSGRIKHFISAFGEHVIGEEVESAMMEAAKMHHAEIVEFTVAPQINPSEGLPYHEWFIEFSKEPEQMQSFQISLDKLLRSKNTYYDDLIRGGVLQILQITRLQKDSFIKYMRSIGKLGGQNKVPRLNNDRNFADGLQAFKK